MLYIHSYIHSLNKKLFINYCMQIIVLCAWNILANKVSLQAFGDDGYNDDNDDDYKNR